MSFPQVPSLPPVEAVCGPFFRTATEHVLYWLVPDVHASPADEAIRHNLGLIAAASVAWGDASAWEAIVDWLAWTDTGAIRMPVVASPERRWLVRMDLQGGPLGMMYTEFDIARHPARWDFTLWRYGRFRRAGDPENDAFNPDEDEAILHVTDGCVIRSGTVADETALGLKAGWKRRVAQRSNRAVSRL
jgi:hypothetical protein